MANMYHLKMMYTWTCLVVYRLLKCIYMGEEEENDEQSYMKKCNMFPSLFKDSSLKMIKELTIYNHKAKWLSLDPIHVA